MTEQEYNEKIKELELNYNNPLEFIGTRFRLKGRKEICKITGVGAHSYAYTCGEEIILAPKSLIKSLVAVTMRLL